MSNQAPNNYGTVIRRDSLGNRKEYLAVARTEEDLKQYEMRLRVAGFRKRRNAMGQSVTGEFYQWWDRKGHSSASKDSQRQIDKQRERCANGCCIWCGDSAVKSTRGRLSQYCEKHRTWQREYMKTYMRNRDR